MNKTFKTPIKYPPRKLDFLKHFKTPKNLPFLFYTSYKGGNSVDPFTGTEKVYPSITLEMGHKPIVEQPTVDDIWPIVKNENIQKSKNHELGRLFAANILCNAIAYKSRRAYGNILFVPNENEKEWYDAQFANSMCGERIVIVDPSLQLNELRATYWKIMYGNRCAVGKVVESHIPMCVDGGIQISPEGFSCIPVDGKTPYNYSSYFARGFM